MTSLATTSALSCQAVRYQRCLHPPSRLLVTAQTCCRLGNIACCHTMLYVQDEAEDEMEELPEVDEQLEEAEEAANRRMDMTSAY